MAVDEPHPMVPDLAGGGTARVGASEANAPQSPDGEAGGGGSRHLAQARGGVAGTLRMADIISPIRDEACRSSTSQKRWDHQAGLLPCIQALFWHPSTGTLILHAHSRVARAQRC